MGRGGNVKFTQFSFTVTLLNCFLDMIWRPSTSAGCDITAVRSHLCVIIPIEVSHKNVPSIAADFSPRRGPATASVLRAFLRLELHFDPRSCLARRGELTEPTIQHIVFETDGIISKEQKLVHF